MKTATVRDLRLHFPMVEGWLSEGESVAITKSGKRVAMLTKAVPEPKKDIRAFIKKRFADPGPAPANVINATEMLIEDRGL